MSKILSHTLVEVFPSVWLKIVVSPRSRLSFLVEF